MIRRDGGDGGNVGKGDDSDEGGSVDREVITRARGYGQGSSVCQKFGAMLASEEQKTISL